MTDLGPTSIRLLFLRPWWSFVAGLRLSWGISFIILAIFTAPFVHKTCCGLCWGRGAAAPLSVFFPNWFAVWCDDLV